MTSMFAGIITPIVTPFHRDEGQTINYEATQELVEYLIKNGVNGIFPLGSNGEFHVLSYEEKITFVKTVLKFVDGRVPVFAGTGSCSTIEAIALAKEMEKLGVDALSVITPYFIKPTDQEIVDHYKKIAASVDLPILLYNIPKSTGINLSIQVVSELAKVENIKGIKDSSGEMENLADYLEIAATEKFEVLVGSDAKILSAMQKGAVGAIAGTSNLIPEYIVGLYQAIQNKEINKAETLQKRIEPLRDVMHLGTVPRLLKRSLERKGIDVGPARLPVEDTEKDDQAVDDMLAYYNDHLKDIK